MKFLKSLLSTSFKISYSKREKVWFVTKNFSVVYAGEKEYCEKYVASKYKLEE